MVLHRVELDGEAAGVAVTDVIRLKLDYSIEAVLDTFSVGVMSVSMK